MRRVLILLLCLMLFSTGVLAVSNISKIDVLLNQVKIRANGQELKTDNFIYKGITYAPVRELSEALNCSTSWEQNTNTIDISNNDITNIKEKVRLLHLFNRLQDFSDNFMSVSDCLYSLHQYRTEDIYKDFEELKKLMDGEFESLKNHNFNFEGYPDKYEAYKLIINNYTNAVDLLNMNIEKNSLEIQEQSLKFVIDAHAKAIEVYYNLLTEITVN